MEFESTRDVKELRGESPYRSFPRAEFPRRIPSAVS